MVTVEITCGEEIVPLTLNAGDNLADAVKLHGEKVVYTHYLARIKQIAAASVNNNVRRGIPLADVVKKLAGYFPQPRTIGRRRTRMERAQKALAALNEDEFASLVVGKAPAKRKAPAKSKTLRKGKGS